MADIVITRDFNGNRYTSSFSEANVDLVFGADDLQSITRNIDLFKENSTIFQLTITSPGKKFPGSIKFAAGTCRGYRIRLH